MKIRQTFIAYRISEQRKKRAEMQLRLDEITQELEAIDEDIRAEIEEPTRSADEMQAMEKHVADRINERDALEKILSEIDEDIAKQSALIEEQNKNHQKETAESFKPAEEERGAIMLNNSVIRSGFFKGQTRQFVDDLIQRDDVKDFIERLKDMATQKRAITGAELGIPLVILPLIREKADDFSKMKKHLNVRRTKGQARQTIMGTIPEAVWIETCTNLNELSLGFTKVDLDGYSVGGYFDICRADLEDSDLLTVDLLFNTLAQSIAKAEDKAVLYGTGVKMPLGIVTRLAQAVQPAGYDPQAPAWTNLSVTNIKTGSAATGLAFYQELMGFASIAKGKYSAGNKFWAMNESTYIKIQQELLSMNSAGAIVTGANMTLPIIGGSVEFLDFIPDGDVIGGYGDLYLWLERAGIRVERSDDVKFIQDHALFKGISRADGLPVIAEGFVAFNVNGVAPTTSVAFPPDTANTVTP